MDGEDLINGAITAKQLGRLIISWANALSSGRMSPEDVAGALAGIGHDLLSGRVIVGAGGMRAMYQWVIYEHPADYPEHFVVRLWTIEAGVVMATNDVWLRDDLDSAREVVAGNCPGSYRLDRQPGDDPVIAEVWI